MPFDKFPHTPSIPLEPFKVDFPQEDLDDLHHRLQQVKPLKRAYESSRGDEYFGVNHEWMTEAIRVWRDEYDWRKTEAEINAFPNYKAQIELEGYTYELHFIAFCSTSPDAVPVVFTHGWPGSILEFIPLLQHLSTTYTPDTLPIHAIVPSLIGYAFSGPSPTDRPFGNADQAILEDKLMRGLGFEGYVAQGGDIGGFISFKLGNLGKGCKAVHLNFCPSDKPDGFDEDDLDEVDKAMVKRTEAVNAHDMSYKDEHALKPATIGFVCDSSPVALLAWIGEKFLIWVDDPLPLHTILAGVSLYWLTHCFPTSMWHYRASYGRKDDVQDRDLMLELKDKPVGYSQFPKELFPSPAAYVKEKVNLVWHRRHDKGGHFAALEVPEVLWRDLLDFIEVAWK